MSRMRATSAAMLLFLLGSAVSSAQDVPGLLRSGITYVAVSPLARAMGDITAVGQGSLTWRADAGVLTVFAASPDGLLQRSGQASPEDVSFAAPVLRDGEEWFVPEDALARLGMTLLEGSVVLPDGRRLNLVLPAPPRQGADRRSEIETLAHGVAALRFFAPEGAGSGGTGDGASLMLTDLDLLALVVPEEAMAVDVAAAAIGSDKALLLVVTALQPESWEATLTFRQGERSVEVRYPYRLKLIDGSAERVGPDAPATAVVLLPPAFSLYRPLTVTWQDLSADVTFRR